MTAWCVRYCYVPWSMCLIQATVSDNTLLTMDNSYSTNNTSKVFPHLETLCWSVLNTFWKGSADKRLTSFSTSLESGPLSPSLNTCSMLLSACTVSNSNTERRKVTDFDKFDSVVWISVWRESKWVQSLEGGGSISLSWLSLELSSCTNSQ